MVLPSGETSTLIHVPSSVSIAASTVAPGALATSHTGLAGLASGSLGAGAGAAVGGVPAGCPVAGAEDWARQTDTIPAAAARETSRRWAGASIESP